MHKELDELTGITAKTREWNLSRRKTTPTELSSG